MCSFYISPSLSVGCGDRNEAVGLLRGLTGLENLDGSSLRSHHEISSGSTRLEGSENIGRLVCLFV